MYTPKWTIVHTDKDDAVVIRRNAVIEDMGGGWILITTQGGYQLTIPLLQLQSITRQEGE